MKKDIPSFEDFIKGRIQEGTFSFDEKYWEAASGRIAELKQADNKRKKRQAAAWLFFSFLLLGGIGFGTWYYMAGDSQPTASSQNEPMPQEAGVFPKEKNNLPSINRTESTIQGPTSLAIEKGVQTVAPSQAGLTENEVNTTVATAEGQLFSTKKTDERDTGSKEEQTSFENKTEAGESEPYSITIPVQAPLPPSSEMPKSMDKEEVSFQKIATLDFLESKQFSISLSEREAPFSDKLIEVEMKKASPWSFDFQLQFATAKLFSSSFLENLNSIGMGLTAKYLITPRWQLSTGLNYDYFVGNIPVSGHEQVKYGFVATTTRYEWGLKKLHLLSVPIQLHFTPAPMHQFSVGTHASYRLKTSGELTVYQGTTLKDDTPILTNDDIDYGAALPQWSWSLNLGYGYQFNEKVMVGIQYRHGLNDLLDDAFFRRVKNDRMATIGLILHYKIQ